LDNAATSFPKPENVYLEMDRCMREYCANPGRSGHEMSLESNKKIMETRKELGGLFGIGDFFQLIFTKNASEALNIAIKGILKPGQRVITTSMEHNSVLRPLKSLQRQWNIEIDIVEANNLGEIDAQDVERCIRPNTALIVSTLSSNVNGTIMPVKDIGNIALNEEIPFLLDASQGAGVLNIDVEKLNVDILAFPGHKSLFGPQGTGGLYVREGISLQPLIEGGTGSVSESLNQPEFLPDRFESGTLNTPGIVGLCEGVRFIKSEGIENIRKHKDKLISRLIEGLREIKGLRLYSIADNKKNSGIVALKSSKYDSVELCTILASKYKIASRGGLHCAPLAHRSLGSSDCGLLRLSPGYFNTFEEIDYVLNALREVQY
jgi:cysteine desulfurase/selenocysteine lyase